jgi:Spy/CpxP family protein refolding chaperone
MPAAISRAAADEESAYNFLGGLPLHSLVLRLKQSPKGVSMNKNRRIVIGSLLFGLAVTLTARPALAQEHRATVESRLEEMSKQLNLTDDQKEKLKPILQDEAKQLQAVQNDTALSHDQKMAKSKEIRQAHKSQINGVLTPDQQKKWEEMKKKAKGQSEKKSEAPPKY